MINRQATPAVGKILKIGSKYNREQIIAFAFLAPAIILFLITKYVPIVVGLFVSLFDISIVDLPGEFVGFDNYARAFTDPYFYKALWHNVKFFLYGMAMTFWPPILLAMLINEQKKGKTFFRLAYYLPAVAPALATQIIFKYFWQPDYGLANQLLRLIGVEGQLWLSDPKWVYFCMEFQGLILAGGMNMLTFLAAMQAVPDSLYEAAVIDGAGFWKRVIHITIPQIKGTIGTVFMFGVIGSANYMDLVMANGGPARSTETIILYAYNQAMYFSDYSYSIAMACIVFFIVLGLTALKKWYEKKKED